MKRGVAIALNTLLLLAGAEGTARVAEWLRPGGDQVVFAYSPYRMLKMTEAPWHLNAEGFRAQALDTYRDSFLVEFVGGSVCLGVGDHPGKTVPERLEGALHREGMVRARVLNLCQGGATSAQELAILIEYGLRLHPQAVLSFDGANDVLHPRPVGEDDGVNLPYRNAQLEARVDGRDGLSHLALARVAGRLAARLAGPTPVYADEPLATSAILDSYLYHLSLARDLVTAQRAFYAVLLQPTLHLDKRWSAEESAMWRTARKKDADPLTHVIHARYAQAREATGRWAVLHDAGFYDLTSVFAAEEEAVYSDSVHFRGSRGYEMLFAELERQGLIKRLCERYHEWETSL